MTKKKETVYEELCKRGPKITAEVMTNVILSFAEQTRDDIDYQAVSKMTAEFLNAPAADYYLCSAQEANVSGED